MITMYSGTVFVAENPADFNSGGFVNLVFFDAQDLVHVPEDNFATYGDVFVLHPKFDISIEPNATTSGAVVIDWGTDINGFVPVVQPRKRVFTRTVKTSTLFPGDVSRGSKLNP